MKTKIASQASTIQSQPISQLNNENSKYLTVQKLEKDSDIRFSFFHVENSTEQIDITMTVHLSFNRFLCLSQLFSLWKGFEFEIKIR